CARSHYYGSSLDYW
nr:immunoglobulin heavy chain junction region [Mus musculus]